VGGRRRRLRDEAVLRRRRLIERTWDGNGETYSQFVPRTASWS
jgi:hypothetical protein